MPIGVLFFTTCLWSYKSYRFHNFTLRELRHTFSLQSHYTVSPSLQLRILNKGGEESSVECVAATFTLIPGPTGHTLPLCFISPLTTILILEGYSLRLSLLHFGNLHCLSLSHSIKRDNRSVSLSDIELRSSPPPRGIGPISVSL